MSKGIHRLSLADLQTKPDPHKAIIKHDGGGLRFVVMSNGSRYWQFRTSKGGKDTTLQLGSFPATTATAARKKAAALREQLEAGLNPVVERRLENVRQKAAEAITVQAVVDELIAIKKRNGISISYREKIEGALRANLLPDLGRLPIQQIESPLLKEVLRPIEARGSLDMLKFVLRITGEVFDLAKASGQFKGDNPAHALKKNVFAKHQKGEMAALKWEEMNGFLQRLDACHGGFATICCIRLMILTATRPGEARGARWTEFDLEAGHWTIPAERMKKRTMHRIALAHQTVALLKSLLPLTGKGEYLFPGQRGAKTPVLSDMALLKAVRRTAGHDDVDAHGFRAVFSTHANDSLLWPEQVIEAALAHSRVGVKGAYDRATHYRERTKLAQWYADELDRAKRGVGSLGIRTAAA